MDYKRLLFTLIVSSVFVVVVNCSTINLSKIKDVKVPDANKQNSSSPAVESAQNGTDAGASRKGRTSSSYTNVLSCVVARDMGCFLHAAQDYLEERRLDVLAQADAQARAMGRGESSTSSHLAGIISKLISEFTDLFKDGISGLFRTAKEGEESDEVEEDEFADEADSKKNDTSVARKKTGARGPRGHKIKKLIAKIKLLILGAVVAIITALTLKAIMTFIQFKALLIAKAGLILKVLALWYEKKKKPQKVIYYEHAQHQHHYDEGHEEDWAHSHSGPSGGEYWGRAYDEKELQRKQSAQNLAYSQQKPLSYTDLLKKTWLS